MTVCAVEYMESNCGWCRKPVHWPSQGDLHSYGKCIGRGNPDAYGEPLAVLTIKFERFVSGDDIRRLARSWAAAISEKKAAAEVHVATRHTVTGPGNPASEVSSAPKQEAG